VPISPEEIYFYFLLITVRYNKRKGHASPYIGCNEERIGVETKQSVQKNPPNACVHVHIIFKDSPAQKLDKG